jgi:hypothetical protein
MKRDLRQLLNAPVLLGASGLACLLTLVTLAWFGFSASPPGADLGFAPADLTMIPASTSTPLTTPTLTPDPLLVGTPTLPANVIAVGGYVQITGTGGDGLRLRELLFLDEESEVFQVRDGPQEANGYTWWYLVAPYDESRSGWAAANFLLVVPPPQ